MTPKLEAFVRRKVAEGLYNNASEVVREALRCQIEAEAPSGVPISELIARLGALEPRLREQGAAALSLVDSQARGEALPGSDVDLLIDLDPEARSSLLDLAAVQRFCEEALARPTDLLTRGALDPAVLITMERDAVRVF